MTDGVRNADTPERFHGHLPLPVSLYLDRLFSGHVVRTLLIFRISFAYIKRRYTQRFALAHGFTSAEWNES